MKRLFALLLLLASACREVVDLSPQDADYVDATPLPDSALPLPDATPLDAGLDAGVPLPDAAAS